MYCGGVLFASFSPDKTGRHDRRLRLLMFEGQLQTMERPPRTNMWFYHGTSFCIACSLGMLFFVCRFIRSALAHKFAIAGEGSAVFVDTIYAKTVMQILPQVYLLSETTSEVAASELVPVPGYEAFYNNATGVHRYLQLPPEEHCVLLADVFLCWFLVSYNFVSILNDDLLGFKMSDMVLGAPGQSVSQSVCECECECECACVT